ncbi:MAG: hypothetical protein IKP57_01605 [Paludibacteraceae bacterium]|nr:hypothetical protein [Paludibacteraceae bacterium]
MKNKLTLCLCALALVSSVFTSCKKDTDILDIESQIAQKNFPGVYYYLGIDSVNVSTTLKEWGILKNGETKNGYYRIATTGNMSDMDTVNNLTWLDASFAPDGLSMIIPVDLKNPKAHKELVWRDGVIGVDGYVTTKSLISQADNLRALHNDFVNYDFVFNDTSYYITTAYDTVVYLAWKTQVVSYTQEQIDSAKQAMILYHDTIAWFNATYPERAVPDTVRFSSKKQSDNTYKGQVSVPFEETKINEIKTNHGPLKIINSEIIFARDASSGATSGSYVYHEQIWTEEFYDDPTSTKARYEDVSRNMSNARWTFSSFTNAKKFNTLFKGNWDVICNITIGGVPQTPEEMHKVDYFYELAFSNFNKVDGDIMLDGHKYKTK